MQRVDKQDSTHDLNKAVIQLLLMAVGISLLLTASILNFNLFATFASFVKSPALMIFSIFVIFLIELLLLTIFNELKMTLSFSFLITILISVINYLKIQFRAEPLIPTDLGFIFDLNSIIRLITPTQIIMISIMVIAMLGIIAYLVYREVRHQTGIKIFDHNRQSTYRRGFILLLSVVMLMSMRSYQVEGSLLKKTLTSFGFKEYEFDILKSYRENGFINGYISNISDEVMLQPEGYSQSAVEAIMKKYQDRADVFNMQAKYDSFEDISVVYILSESTSNPDRVKGVNIDSNPLEFITDPVNKSLKGLMVSPVYGGSTANTEFEILTGLSMQYLSSNSIIPFKGLIPEFDSFPSMVQDFKKNNESAKAYSLHSYNNKLFKRPEVYETFGFDESLFDEDMRYQDTIDDSTYISDESTYKEALDLLKQEGNQFINVVTMQNHSPFTDKYDTQYPGITLDEEDEELQNTLASYTQGIKYSDDAMKEFMDEIMNLDKKVVVVYYGDHLPGLYNSLLEQNDDPFDLYQTEYFITKNFDQDVTGLAQEMSASANSMSALTHAVAGVKVNPLHMLNLSLTQKAIGGNAQFYKTNQGTTAYADLDDETKTMIEEFKMIQYDLLVGEFYAKEYLN